MIWVRILVPVPRDFRLPILECRLRNLSPKIKDQKSKIKNLMNKVSTYFRESIRELMEKVTWPTWAQLQQSTLIVLIATVIITGVVWVMDLASNGLLKLVYSLFA